MNIVQRGGGVVTIFRSYGRLHLTLSNQLFAFVSKFYMLLFLEHYAMSTILDTLLVSKFILHAV